MKKSVIKNSIYKDSIWYKKDSIKILKKIEDMANALTISERDQQKINKKEQGNNSGSYRIVVSDDCG